MDNMMMQSPVLGALSKISKRGKREHFAAAGAHPNDLQLAIMLIIGIVFIGLAVWLATECNTFTDYLIAVFFPVNYIIVRLLAPCK